MQQSNNPAMTMAADHQTVERQIADYRKTVDTLRKEAANLLKGLECRSRRRGYELLDRAEDVEAYANTLAALLVDKSAP